MAHDWQRRHWLRTVAALALTACSGGGGGGSGNANGNSPPLPPPPPPPPPPSPPPPPPGAGAITPQPGSTRSIPAGWFGYNFNALRAADVLDRSDFTAALAGLHAGTLRLPGGTVGEYWDWSRGGLAEPPYPGLPEGPPFGPGQLAITGVSPERMRALLANAGAAPVFALNVLSATLATNLADLDRFAALGLPVSHIELGNEEYFRSPNTLARFPDADAYALLARDWASAVRARFPDVRLAAIAPSPVRLTGIAFNDWTDALTRRDVWSVADAIAIHPYAEAAFNTAARSDLQASAAVAGLVQADRTYLAAVRARIPATTRIWITEWNIVDNSTPLVMAGSWVHGLASLARALAFLDTEAVDLALQHVVIGDQQWQALTGLDGRAISYNQGLPGTTLTAPFTPIPSAITLALLGRVLRTATNGVRLTLVADEAQNPAFGWRFSRAGNGVASVFVNATAAPLSLALSGRARVLSAPAWSSPLGGQGLSDQIVTPGTSGLMLPGFSAALVDESGSGGLF